jgi:hypothetical protein
MEPVNIKSFYEYLCEGYTVAQLATAVEKHGISGWDSFGRFGAFKPKSDGAMLAFKALADFYSFETAYYNRRDALSMGQDMTSVFDHLKGMDTQIEFFGWPIDKLPSIDRSEVHPPRPSTRRQRYEESAPLMAVGALLECLHNIRKSKRPTIPNESGLIDEILDTYTGIKYITKGTLQNVFTDAKVALKERLSDKR